MQGQHQLAALVNNWTILGLDSKNSISVTSCLHLAEYIKDHNLFRHIVVKEKFVHVTWIFGRSLVMLVPHLHRLQI